VDLKAAGERGIPVCNVPDYGTADVADHTMALLLSLMRGLPAYDAAAREPKTWVWTSAGPLRRMTGARLGLIGLGRIGSAVALRAKAFGMRVIFYDPYISDGYDKVLGIERATTVDALLSGLDAVSFHVPLTSETKGMASANFFAKLSPGTVFINTARGGIVDQGALAAALRSGQVRAAGLDVLNVEPASQTDPLVAAWCRGEEWVRHRLIITPHAAFFCAEAYEEMRRKAARTVRDVLNGGQPRNVVNRPWLV
jgi:phosphoglycerate dehydrogenase-like enzyme